MTLKNSLELMKLRIGVMITATALTGYVAVADEISYLNLLLLSVVMMLGSGASAVFNHVWDADIDRQMRRTARRPMVMGTITVRNALLLASGLMLTGLVLASLTLNPIVALHLFLGAFVYAVIYTIWLKRRTLWNIVVGGAAGSFAILAGAAVVQPETWALPTLLAITLFLWTPSHFWALAILLKDDYAQAGIPMLPVVVGEHRTAYWILGNSLALVASSMLPYGLGLLGAIYAWGAGIFGLVLLGFNLKLCHQPSRFWAGWNFAITMPYLLGLFGAVFFDKYWN